MTNPFEDETGTYVVLRNAEGQHSIWPDFVEVPEGWSVVHGPARREDGLAHIEEHWTDMRPNSLQKEEL